MEAILTPRVFHMRVVRDLLHANDVSDEQLFVMAARYLGIPEYEARARIDHQEFLVTGYPPPYIEGAYVELLKVALRNG